MTNLPPPPQDRDLPDYYLGMLIVYDDFSPDACKWVVYDGVNRVRCYTRNSAIDYINSRAKLTVDRATELAARARYYIISASNALDKAAAYSGHADRLLLEQLSVDLRPHLVRLDNYLTYAYRNDNKNDNQKDKLEIGGDAL